MACDYPFPQSRTLQRDPTQIAPSLHGKRVAVSGDEVDGGLVEFLVAHVGDRIHAVLLLLVDAFTAYRYMMRT